MDKSVMICRCEEINIDEIETVLKLGAERFDDIKRITRCGMGPCQAKMCFKPVAQLISDYTGKSLSEIPPARARMPLRMTRMSVMASNQDSGSTVKAVFEDGDPDDK